MNEAREKRLKIDGESIEVEWLMYRSYAHNRDRFPHVSPERWKALYLNQETYEKIYQGVEE